MKVCIVNIHRNVSSGGSEIQCDLIARELVIKGYEVFYITPTPVSDISIFDSLPYKVVPTTSSFYAICQVIKKICPDVVYWRSYKKNFFLTSLYLKVMKIKLVFAVSHIHDLDPRVFFCYSVKSVRDCLRVFRNAFTTCVQLMGYRNVDAMTTLNKDYLHLLPSPNRYYIPNAMVTDYLDFNWDRPFCIWVANIKKPKRPELFVKLAKHFEKVGVDFIMIGRFHEEFNELKWVTNDKLTPSNFYYLGERSPEFVNGALRKSLFHVHTCEPEGFGNIFIQAWLLGIPSVSLNFNPGSLLNDKFGFYCDSDWDLFIDKVDVLIKDHELRSAMGKEATDFSNIIFSPKRLGEQVDSLIKEII